MADYSYSERFTLYSGGYDHEITGTEPENDPWHDGTPEGDSADAVYYFHDSNSGENANSCRVKVRVKDSWTAKKNSDNSITITLDSDIVSICREHYQGDPAGAYPNAGRTIAISSTLADSQARNYIKNYGWWSVTDYSCREGVMNIPRRSITLAPGQEGVITNSLFVHSWTGSQANPDQYYTDPAVPTAYHDSMGCGVAFKNNLPKGFGHGLHYDPNGGRDAPPDQEWISDEECDQMTVSTHEPNSPHWIFKGWSTDKNATTPSVLPGGTVTVCETLTLYAVWEYTYRPGMCRHNGTFYSHDRDGQNGPIGCANVRRGGKWIEMRTRAAASGLSDPPCIEANGAWRVQQLIGVDGKPHHITWDCPHQWN